MRREGGAGGFNAYVTSQPSALRSPLSWPTSSRAAGQNLIKLVTSRISKPIGKTKVKTRGQRYYTAYGS